jgi:hypothetical protein
MQMAPRALLEGCPTGSRTQTYIPECPQLNHEICALHHLARTGIITTDTAERQLNTYLAAAANRLLVRSPKALHWMLLPLADAPHHSHLPDLGHVIHRVLARCPLPGSLSSVIEQSIPCLRHTPRPTPFTDSQDVVLNLVLALLLGLYPGGNIKRPCFSTRAVIYARVHALLTASREEQTAFCVAHNDAILLAAMEYVTRVLPAYIPAQAAFLTEKDTATNAYFRRIPALCDELRLELDTLSEAPSWQHVLTLCSGLLEKVNRLKKSNTLTPSRDQAYPLLPHAAPRQLHALWNTPLLQGTPDEYRILGNALGLQDNTLCCIQQSVRVFRLPENLRQLQLERIAQMTPGASRTTFLKTRHYICMHCTLAHKSTHALRLRLDTLRQTMVCSSCSTDGLISVDLVGRVLQTRRQFMYLCPGCVSIQEYKGGEQPWLTCPLPGTSQSCTHHARPKSRPPPRQKRPCFVCQESAPLILVERVDHLTGRMVSFSFCQRHVPRTDLLVRCVNARLIETHCA